MNELIIPIIAIVISIVTYMSSANRQSNSKTVSEYVDILEQKLSILQKEVEKLQYDVERCERDKTTILTQLINIGAKINNKNGFE